MNFDKIDRADGPAEKEGWPIGCLQADLEGPIDISGRAQSLPMQDHVRCI